jgi:dCTP diphosphatase
MEQSRQMAEDSLTNLRNALRQFALERDWEQFHTHKNLACAVVTEAAELLAHFRWSSEDIDVSLSETEREAISQEIADVLLFLVRLSDKLGIDPILAAKNKLKINADRYPVEKARGSSKKYTEL